MAQNGCGFMTSIELVRQQGYSTVSGPTLKREHDQICSSGPLSPCKRSTFVPSETSVAKGDVPCSRFSESNKLTASKLTQISDGPVEISSKASACHQLPSASLNPLLTLSHFSYGLPDSLVKNFASLGIETIYPWQSSCLHGRGLLTGEKNLVYTAPTGGGKSLVADVLMLKRVLGDPHAKAILVLPYVALVQEKVAWLRRLVEGVEKDIRTSDERTISKFSKRPPGQCLRVVGFFGNSKTRATWSDIDVAVCTFEKANLLVNTAIEQCTIDDLAVVVLDELHMIDDGHRGYLMELLATKILSLERRVQIIGMSATLPNTRLLAQWLNAKYYESKFKPVPIKEYLVCNGDVYPVSTSSAFCRAASQTSGSQTSLPAIPCRKVQASTHKELRDAVTNAVVALAIGTVSEGFGALVFCGGRQACQATALLVSKAMPDCNDDGVLRKRQDILHDLRILPAGLDEVLEITIPQGVAFHRMFTSCSVNNIQGYINTKKMQV
ncbi:MAG: hypothetical protein Q9220_001403 [cf. Caloplaca sp. 1 TL-2023]